MTHPLVTIAIPCYKAKYLKEAISSALAQTYDNLEVIVVNDCSPQDIDSVIQGFNDPRLHYFTNASNVGGKNPALNWNRCLQLAHGEFFALLCDDDLYEPTFVEQMLQLAEKHPDVAVFRARANFINAEGTEVNRYASAPEWESWDDYLWHVSKGYRSQTISEWMMRRTRMTDVGGYALLPLAWYADYLSVFRFAKDGGIASTYKILVHFRLSGENISSRDSENNLIKIEAQNQYRDAVAQMLQGHPDADMLYNTMNWVLREHLKYNLKHTPKKVLWYLYRHKKHYHVHSRDIWQAFWSNTN